MNQSNSSQKVKNYKLITLYWSVIIVALFFLLKIGQDATVAANLIP
jgi:hypothetical protein